MPKAIKLEGRTVQKCLQKYHILSGPLPPAKISGSAPELYRFTVSIFNPRYVKLPGHFIFYWKLVSEFFVTIFRQNFTVTAFISRTVNLCTSLNV